MLQVFLRLPIASPAVLVPVDVVAALLVTWAVLRPVRAPRGPGWRLGPGLRVRVTALVAGGLIGLLVVWWFGDVRDEFGVAPTPVLRMWVAFTAAAVALGVVVVVQGGWGQRTLGVLGTVAVLLATGLGVNVDFGAYRTLGQAVTVNPYPSGSLGHEHPGGAGEPVVGAATWHAPASMPRTGVTLSVRIPGTVSHFRARKAVVWLPPAARVADPPTLPVLVALSGQPGAPADMFRSGALGHYLDRYAASHAGLAPIVVAPDQLGAPGRNPMCVDSRALGRSATYVMTDTVGWIRSHLDVGGAPSAWGILGFSQGATCSMQFSAAHPDVFGTTLAISSELAPRNGDLRHTVDVGFGGSSAAYRVATPSAILARNGAYGRYTGHLTVFGYGADDARYADSTTDLRAAAVRAGMTTRLVVSPGTAHDWNTVRYVLRQGLPAVLGHLGLPDGATP